MPKPSTKFSSLAILRRQSLEFKDRQVARFEEIPETLSGENPEGLISRCRKTQYKSVFKKYKTHVQLQQLFFSILSSYYNLKSNTFIHKVQQLIKAQWESQERGPRVTTH